MIRHLLIGGLLAMGLTAKVHGQLNVPVDFCWGERGIFSEWHPLSGDGSTKADLVAIVPEGEEHPLAGKVYLIGTSLATGPHHVVTITRLNADGTRDVSFGDNGWLTVGPQHTVMYLRGAAIDSQYRLVISGSRGAVNGMSGFVVRLNLDGTLDTTFATGGVYTSTFGNAQSRFLSMTLADDDSILLSGYTETVGNADDQLLLARINANGVTSAQWTEAGSTYFASNEYYKYLVTTSTGEYLALRTEDSLPLRISRRGPNLEEVATVSVPLPLGYSATWSYGMIPVEDGKVVIALPVQSSPDGAGRSVLVRVNSDLTLDASFGNGGVSETVDLISGSADSSNVFIRGLDGGFYLAPQSNKNFTVVRWNADGSLDDTFGVDGRLNVSLPGTELHVTNIPYHAALTASGDVIIAGDNRRVRGGGSFGAVKLWGNVEAEKQQFCHDVVALPQAGYIRPGGSGRVMKFEVVVSGAQEPLSLTGVSFATTGTTNPGDIKFARLYYGVPGGDPLSAVQVATLAEPGETFSFDAIDVELTHGINNFWLAYTLVPSVQLNNQYDAVLNSVKLDGQSHTPNVGNPPGSLVAAEILAEWDVASFDPSVASTIPGVSHVPGLRAGDLRLGSGLDLVTDEIYAGAILGLNWPAGPERGGTDYLEISLEASPGLFIIFKSAIYAVSFDSTWDYHLPGTMEVQGSLNGFLSSVEIAKHHADPDYYWVIEQQKVNASLVPLGAAMGPLTAGLRWYPYHETDGYGGEEWVGAGLTNMSESSYVVGEGSNLYIFGVAISPEPNVTSISRHSPAATRVGGGGTATFRAYFDKPISGLLTTDFAFADAVPGAEIASVQPVGSEASFQWDITVTLPEEDAVVQLVMVSAASAIPHMSGLPYTGGEAYIVDSSLVPEAPVPTVTLSASEERIPEGSTVTITAALDIAASVDTEVELSLGGTATEGDDYSISSTTIIIPAGQLSADISIDASSDGIDEPDETIVVSIAEVTGGDGAIEAAPQQVTVTIEDIDEMPSLSVEDVSVIEGDSGYVLATFAIELSAPSAFPVTVAVATEPGTATEAEDYVPVNTSVSFMPGVVRINVTVLVVGDTLPEEHETFFLTLRDPVNATIADASGRGTILDNDDAIAPTVLSVTRLSPGSQQTNASSVSFKVTFSELVTNVDVGDFYLTGTSATADGSTAHVASVVAASDAEATEDDEWIVTVDGINSAGTLFLEVIGLD